MTKCKKEVVDPNIFQPKIGEDSKAQQRDSISEVHSYYIDGTVSSQIAYQNKLTETGVYEHIILEPTTTENNYAPYVFSTKAGYTQWGDARGFKISKAIYVADRLAFVADSAGLNQLDSNSM